MNIWKKREHGWIQHREEQCRQRSTQLASVVIWGEIVPRQDPTEMSPLESTNTEGQMLVAGLEE